jgi:hypothetical protein
MNFNENILLALTTILVACGGLYVYNSKNEPVNTYTSYKPVEQPKPVVPVVPPANVSNVGGSRRNRRKKSHKKTKKR